MTAPRPVRVAGTDPGTGSLDVLVLDRGVVVDQARFLPEDLRADPSLACRWLEARGPFDLIAGPSGYGLPLTPAVDCGERERRLMALVRPDERGRPEAPGGGVAGFSAMLEAFCASGLPVVFLPGVVHLPTVPGHRKVNRIDLGTPDKLCVAALAVAHRAAGRGRSPADTSACVVELGSVFAACVVVRQGQVVDGAGGTSGPVGWAGGGAWDGEVAYLLSPLGKRDLFEGGAGGLSGEVGVHLFTESLVRTAAGLAAVTPVDEVVLSGRLLELRPDLGGRLEVELARVAPVVRLGSLSGAWVKHAAQGAAVLADGLAGGVFAPVVERLRLAEAAGTVLDGLVHARAPALRRAFGV